MTAYKPHLFDKIFLACFIAIYPLTAYLFTWDLWGDPPGWVLLSAIGFVVVCVIGCIIGVAFSPNTIRGPKGKKQFKNKEFYHDGKNLHITIKNYKRKRRGYY